MKSLKSQLRITKRMTTLTVTNTFREVARRGGISNSTPTHTATNTTKVSRQRTAPNRTKVSRQREAKRPWVQCLAKAEDSKMVVILNIQAATEDGLK